MSMERISSLLHFGKKKKKKKGKYFPKISSCGRKEIKFHIAQQRANNPERDPVTVSLIPDMVFIADAHTSHLWFCF